MHKVRALSLLLFILALFTITPPIVRAETLPDDQSISDLDPQTGTPTPEPVTFTATAEVTATPDALPSAGVSSSLFLVLVAVLILSSGAYYLSATRRA